MASKKSSGFLLEIFSIIFAVLLALALDSWRENINNQNKLDIALTDIFDEISNINSGSRILNIYEMPYNQLSEAINNYEKGVTIPDSILGFGRAEYRTIAWEVSRENDIISSIDRELLKDLSEVYKELDRLLNLLNYSREFSLKADPDMPNIKYAKHLRKQLSRVISRTKEVHRKTGLFLEKYKGSKYLNS